MKENENVLISFVIPFYNTEIDDIRACISSIEDQNLKNYEIVLVDDGSNKNYIRSFESQIAYHKNVEIIHQSNRGVSAARNAGVMHSKGKYVTFVDADDVLVSESYNEGLEIIEKYELDCVIGKITKLERHNTSKVCKRNRNHNEINYYNSTDAVFIDGIFGTTSVNMYDDNEWRVILESPVAKIIKKASLQKTRFPESISISEDTIWNYLYATESSKRIGVLDSEWYCYIQNGYSALNHYSAKLPTEVLKAVQQVSVLTKERDYISPQYCLWLIGKLQQITNNYLHDECDLKVKERIYQIRTISNNEAFQVLKRDSHLLGSKDRAKIKLFSSGMAYFYYKFKGVF